jgi:hypothetical protein
MGLILKEDSSLISIENKARWRVWCGLYMLWRLPPDDSPVGDGE